MANIAPMIIAPKPIQQAPAPSPSTSATPGSENQFGAELSRAVASRGQSGSQNGSQDNSEPNKGAGAGNQPAEYSNRAHVESSRTNNVQSDGSPKDSIGAARESGSEIIQQQQPPMADDTSAELPDVFSTNESVTLFQLIIDLQKSMKSGEQLNPGEQVTPQGERAQADQLTTGTDSKAQAEKSATESTKVPIQMQMFSTSGSFTHSASGKDGSIQASITAQHNLTGSFATTIAIPETKAADSMLTARLQELVQNNETGVISITRQQSTGETALNELNGLARSPLLSTPAETAMTVNASAASTVTEEPSQLAASFSQLTNLKGKTADNSEKPVASKLEPLRQDVQGLYLEAKIEEQAKGKGETANQQMNQQETMARNLPLTGTSTFSVSDQGSAFAQTLHGVQTGSQYQQQNIAVAQPTTTTTPGALFNEDSIVNQVAERFQFNTRNLETQLQIKLQPAELGELKIDLSIKDGAIKAHVVAQSGQAQEILEKNMAKLKEILEGQGLTIEEIVVSQKPETTGGFDLFQDHLSKGDSQHHESSPGMSSEFTETFEEMVTESLGPASGVNLTV